MKTSRARALLSVLFATSAFACLTPAASARPHHGDGDCGHDDDDASVEIVASFDASKLETPESVAIDSHDNIFVSLALTGEIRRIAPDGTQSTFAVLPISAPPLTFCGSYLGIMGALAIDHRDNLYVTLDSCDPSSRGVWKVSRHGEPQMLAALPMEAEPDGIVLHHGNLYVADANLGVVWSLPSDGSEPATIWADDPLLHPSDGHLFPGPNGIQFFDGELYVSNSDQGTILAIPLGHDGSAGPVRVHAEGVACDDFAFDVHGDIYCTTDPFNTLVRISQDGSSEVLLTADDGLDGPSAAMFGRRGGDRRELYVTNGAFPFFSTTLQPTLMKIDLGVPGAPR